MDSKELNKVANRKKISSDVEKLRERVQREKRDIIKLRVAQDTAYWDVKEKLRQTETNHEKLQQNMVELQMQYETVSGKYQDEIRFRTETLNKLASTREISDVLEDYTERLCDTLSRCKADQVSLCEAYQKSGQVVRDLKDKQTNANKRTHLVIQNLQEKVRISNEHNAQMLQFYNDGKQRMESELQDIKTKLSEAGKVKEEVLNPLRDLSRQLEACCRELQKKEESIKALQNEINQMCDKFNAQTTEMNHALQKEKELNKELTCNIEALQQALANQETYTNSVVSQNNSLEEKLADLGNEVTKKDDCINQMQDNIQNTKAANEDLVTAIANINEEKKCLQQELEQKNEVQRNMEIDIQNLTRQLSILEIEKADTGAELSLTMNEMRTLASRLQEVTSVSRDLEGEVQELKEKMQVEREGMENNAKQLTTTLEEKERDLVNKDCTITKLMGDVKHGLDFQSELKSKIQKLEQDIEIQRQKIEEQVAEVAQLKVVIKEKDNDLRTKDQEFNKNMTVVKELRTDKERLNQKVMALQMKIEGVKQQLYVPVPASRMLTADHDDNAIMLTPTKNTNEDTSPSLVFVATQQQRNEPRPAAAAAAAVNDEFIFSFISESSEDGIDPQEVNHRFAALNRGEKLPPIPGSAVNKRRRPDTSSTTQPRYIFKQPQRPTEEDDVPLSEINTATGSKKAKDRVFFKNKPRRGDSSKR